MPKAILIDSTKREVREVELPSDNIAKLEALHDAIGGYVCLAYAWDNADVLFVDDEGLLKAQESFFLFAPRQDGQPLAGNGIVVGREVDDADGGYHNEDPAVSVEEVAKMVRFISRGQADAWAKANASEPAMTISRNDGPPEVITTFGRLFDEMPKPRELYAMEADHLRKLRAISEQLHGGTDVMRNIGHRLWLILTEIETINRIED